MEKQKLFRVIIKDPSNNSKYIVGVASIDINGNAIVKSIRGTYKALKSQINHVLENGQKVVHYVSRNYFDRLTTNPSIKPLIYVS